MLRNHLAYFFQNSQIQNWRILVGSQLSLFTTFHVFFFQFIFVCLPDMCTCTILQENQSKRKFRLCYRYIPSPTLSECPSLSRRCSGPIRIPLQIIQPAHTYHPPFSSRQKSFEKIEIMSMFLATYHSLLPLNVLSNVGLYYPSFCQLATVKVYPARENIPYT